MGNAPVRHVHTPGVLPAGSGVVIDGRSVAALPPVAQSGRRSAAPVQQPQCMAMEVDVPRDSVAVDATDDPNFLRLRCTVDATAACRISVHYFVSIDDAGVISSRSGPTCITPLQCPQVGMEWIQPEDSPVDVRKFAPHDLVCSTADASYPLAIVVETLAEPFQQHTSLLTLERGPAGRGYVARVMRQQARLHGECFVVQEIFGLERQSSEAECVVCMSEPRSVMVLPCRHMCLCFSCAETFRYQTNRCPICRGLVQSMLQVLLTEDCRRALASELRPTPAAGRRPSPDAAQAGAPAALGAEAVVSAAAEGSAAAVAPLSSTPAVDSSEPDSDTTAPPVVPDAAGSPVGKV